MLLRSPGHISRDLDVKPRSPRHESRHLLLCALLIIAGVVLVSSRRGTLAFLPLLACVLMMGGMMHMMVRPGRDDRGEGATRRRGIR